jgi:hypothetical protein
MIGRADPPGTLDRVPEESVVNAFRCGFCSRAILWPWAQRSPWYIGVLPDF